ncbi:MAG: AI-2E family transporter [Candidatus Nomurabacteria bacterium]|nr:AI-2E family transporter [Candidatus Nomurabacteria bacterium]
MEKKRLEIVSFLVLCTLILILTFLVFKPFLNILVLAAILSLLFRPLYKRMLRHHKNGSNFFAIVIVLISLVFLIIPILFFGVQILGQMQNFFTLIQNGQGQHMQEIQESAQSVIRNFFPTFTLNISYYASMVLNFISSNLGLFLSQAVYIFFEIFFILFTFFFFLRDGDKIFSSLIALSPFEKEQNREVLTSMHRAITSVIRGTLFVGLIRWVLFTVGFYLFGIQDFMVWGSIAAIIGAIPGLGTPFVIVPAVIYLVLSGSMFYAIGLGIFGVLIMVFVDNMLSAYFFGKGLDAPPIFILFSILGGVLFFGPLGFIFGPIVLSLCISIIEMYKILILKR